MRYCEAMQSKGRFAWAAPPARSLFRRPAFWILQVVGWFVIVLAYWGKPMAGWLEDGLSPTVAATVLLLGTFLAVVFSSGLAWAYVTLPERWFAGGKAIPVLVGSSMVGALSWTGAIYFCVGRLVPVAPLLAFYERTLPPLAIMMFGWCALFLLTLLSGRTQKARDEALRSEALAVQAQLRALRAQTNPHFLLNSLSSVVTLIHEDADRAEQMVHDLSGLFVRSLDASQRETTTIGDELDFLGLYLRCEGVRFEERLDVEVEVPQPLRSQAIPSMLLQPLVENALKHGLPGTRRLQLVIRAYESRGRTVFEVRNTGRLVDHDTRESSTRGARVDSPAGGAGLRIVQRRLAAMYPTSGAFELVEENGWVVARLAYDPERRHPSENEATPSEIGMLELRKMNAA